VAQLEPVKIKLEVDLSEIHEARVVVKRLQKDLDGLNRTLARLEEKATGIQVPLLDEFGINLEVS
jgi:hypothetical protein